MNMGLDPKPYEDLDLNPNQGLGPKPWSGLKSPTPHLRFDPLPPSGFRPSIHWMMDSNIKSFGLISWCVAATVQKSRHEHLAPNWCQAWCQNPSMRYEISVPNFGPHVLLHGHWADGPASSQPAAHIPRPPLILGRHTHPKKGGSGVVRVV